MTKPAQKPKSRPGSAGKAGPAAPQRSLGKRVMFSLVPALLLFGALELVLRGLGVPADLATIGEFDFPPRELYGQSFLRDPELFWRLAPDYNGPWSMYKSRYTHERSVPPDEMRKRVENFPDAGYYRRVSWEINSAGCRGALPRADQRVVLFVGSSVTFGWGVRAEDSFPGLIRGRLEQEPDSQWSVVNAGVPGYSSYQCLRHLEELLPKFKPRVVVVEVGINDGVWAPGLPDAQMAGVLVDSWTSRLIRSSHVLFAANGLLHGTGRHAPPADVPPDERFFYSSMFVPGHVRVSEEEFRANIGAMEQSADGAGAAILFLFPGLYNEYGDKRLVKSVRFSHPREVKIVDAIHAAAGSDPVDYFLPYDEAHLSVKGHRLVADTIWERLTGENLLQAAQDGTNDSGADAGTESAAPALKEESRPDRASPSRQESPP